MSKPEVQYIEIDDEHVDRRIDNFLLTKLKGVPKSHLYLLMRKGEIRVNKKRIKPAYRLQLNDIVRIAPIRVAQELEPINPKQELVDKLLSQILYEDEGLLILNKPSGLAVHGGSGIRSGVIELLRFARPEARFLELVHRLDRDTSGCLIIAKKRSVLKELHQLLKDGRVTKIYFCLTLGHWRKEVTKVNKPLRKNVLQSGERLVKESQDGKPSLTEFKVIQKLTIADFMEAVLHTGRTHQIRVHAQLSGHNVAGDDKYGDRAFNRLMSQKGLRRLFLHAGELRFKLPSLEQEIAVKAELPEELQKVLDALGSAD